MKKLTITTMAAVGLAISAASVEAQLTALSPGGTVGPLTGASYTPSGSALDTVTSIFNFGADSGTLTTSVYGDDTLGGDAFVYTLTISEGDLSGITADGYIGGVIVGASLGLSSVEYNDYGGIDFTLSTDANAGKTVTFVVESSTASYGAGTIAFKDNSGGNISSLQPVPEASTAMAGALMLLPLGIGAIRAVRKERTV